jgi:hypothetical protein
MWTVQTPTANCNGLGTTNRLLSSPAAGAIMGDGVPYVVIGYGGPGRNICDGGVMAIRGTDGQVAWTFSLKNFARRSRFGANNHAAFSSPAIADTDGDGKMEIAFGSFDRNVYLLNHNGKVRWYYNAADTVWSSAAFANIDNDPQLELLIGTDISQNTRLRPPTQNGGFLYAFDTAPRRKKKITFQSAGAYIWRTPFDQVVQSSPVVADVIPGNPGKEVVIGAGCFFPQGSSDKRGRYIKVLRLSDGAVLETFNTSGCFTSTVAVGDINEDGIQEIVASINGDPSIGGDSRLEAFRSGSPTPIWSVIPREGGRNDPFGGNYISPVIADIDGNGSLEVLLPNSQAIGIYEGKTGTPLTCQGQGCSRELTLFAWKTLRSSATVADVNNDGVLDVVIGGSHAFGARRGFLYSWTNLAGILGSSPGSLPAYFAPWPSFRGNPQNTGTQ